MVEAVHGEPADFPKRPLDTIGIFTQEGGTVTSTPTLKMGASVGSSGEAIYNLYGGTLKIDDTTPFLFAADTGPIYFNFGYGTTDNAALILKGTSWDYGSLTGITNSDFRLYDDPVGEGQLIFTAGTDGLAGYTIINAVPEPTSLTLLLLGAVGLLWLLRRRRK